nr:uncharacterized protein LOC119164151 [Rhipicephalus microplus]XP_037272163.1 uncharacterized protein LOC119164151 [Rhipicephalus microplus]XP_037272164.1 uncharacterized protein LOC119164151 [Rhipicephalus microplus]
MAGVKASFDDQNSSGPEESLSSYYVKVTLKDGQHVTCKLHAENAGNLPRCINCYFFITSWVRLVCRHNLCIECFKNSMTFVCPADSTQIFKSQASTGSCTYGGTWKDVLIECALCGALKDPNSIASHIEKEHPVTQQKSRTARELVQEPTEIWGNNEPRNFIPNGYEGRDPECSNTGPSKLHEGVTDTKTDNSDTRCKDERQNCNFTGYVGRGQEFQKKEQSDLPPTAIESEEKHKEALSKYFTECTICKINIYSKDFIRHEQLCQDQSRNEPEASPGVKQGDESAEKQDLDDEVRELKHKINVLKDRLDNIEEPLLITLGRLYENHVNAF